MNERLIARGWMESAVEEPDLLTSDPNDPEVERFFRHLPEHGHEVLRVADSSRVLRGAW